MSSGVKLKGGVQWWCLRSQVLADPWLGQQRCSGGPPSVTRKTSARVYQDYWSPTRSLNRQPPALTACSCLKVMAARQRVGSRCVKIAVFIRTFTSERLYLFGYLWSPLVKEMSVYGGQPKVLAWEMLSNYSFLLHAHQTALLDEYTVWPFY